MGNSKYSGVLTVILVISIIAIIGLLVYLGIDWYIAYTSEVNANDSVDKFDDYINNLPKNTVLQPPLNSSNTNDPALNIEIENITPSTNTNTGSSGSSGNNGLKMEGYSIIGKIEIPKTKVNYTILDAYTPRALQLAICKLYGPGLNEVGNTVLIGHNYRDGRFFSNNSRLSNGDKIYITDITGKRVTYEIYKIYTTTTSEFSYATRDTNGKREISLSTCSNDTKSRLVIWAVEK